MVFAASAQLSVAFLKHLSRKKATLSREIVSQINVADLRKDYSAKGINDTEEVLCSGPMAFFKQWFEEALAVKILEPNAMSLATCENNIPTCRVVLMKGFDDEGFVWFTNYNSRKGHQLAANPVAALTFWWAELERSVRIEGTVQKVSDAESDAYFNSRPRGSQIGAWSSNQSCVINSRAELDEHEHQVRMRFSDPSVPVPRPPHWGGFRLIPTKIEFWKGRSSRMHDRLVFERDSDFSEWERIRLQP